MSVYRDKKNGKWYVSITYKDYNGELRRTTKRGFLHKSEAMIWERDFLARPVTVLSMKFIELCEVYKKERYPRLKESTINGLENIINHKLIPTFGEMQLKDITPKAIECWQNEIKQGCIKNSKCEGPLENSYVNRVTNTLSAIMNHAVRYYGLDINPVDKVDRLSTIGNKKMNFWTIEEFNVFSTSLEDDKLAHVCFETLYWTGMREGELMALNWEDIDLEKKEIRITKTMHKKSGKEIITSPKTDKSNRIIKLTDKLVDELTRYKEATVDAFPNAYAFPVTPYYLYRRMRKGCSKVSMDPIRIHDLRHSHVSLLIHLGFSAVDIAERMGHETADITYHYSHLFPSEQDRMAKELDYIRIGKKAEHN